MYSSNCYHYRDSGWSYTYNEFDDIANLKYYYVNFGVAIFYNSSYWFNQCNKKVKPNEICNKVVGKVEDIA